MYSGRKLTVALVLQIGRQNMYLLKQFTKYDTIRRKLTINLHEQYGELEAGIHEFAWSFVVPSTTAPYERYAQRVFYCRSGTNPFSTLKQI